MSLSYLGWLLSLEVSQVEQLQDLRIISLYSTASGSGLPANSFRSVRGTGITSTSVGTAATRASTPP